MTTETKVTHTPWRLEESPYLHIRNDEGCVWANDYKPRETGDLIVRAVNSHADMLEALEGAAELIDIMLTGTDVDIFRQRDAAKAWQKSVRTIVAKARGGAA